MRVIPPFDEIKQSPFCCGPGLEGASLQQLPFQRSEETLAHRVRARGQASRSKQSPTDPIEGRTPACWQRVPKAIEVYCDP